MDILQLAITEYVRSSAGVQPDIAKCNVDEASFGARIDLHDVDGTLLASYSYLHKTGIIRRINPRPNQ